MKYTFLTYTLLIMMSSGCNPINDTNDYKSSIGFLVEKGCESSAQKYETGLNKVKGIKAILSPITYENIINTNFAYHMLIKSNLHTDSELKGYAHGISSGCGANSITEYNLQDKNSLNNLFYRIKLELRDNPSTKLHSYIHGNKLFIYAKSD